MSDAPSGNHGDGFKRRAVLFGLAQLAGFGLVGARLYELQVVEGNRYRPLADDNRITVHTLTPRRGVIVDRYGTLLAGNVEAYRAMLIPSRSPDVAAVVERAARIVPIAEAQQARLIARARRQAPNVPIVLADELSWEQMAELNLHAPSLPGVETEPAELRRYHHGHTVAHVVGYVGGVERVAIDDEPLLRQPGIRVGRSGVERGLDDELRGIAGTVRREVDARGRIVRDLDRTEPRSGANVVLTLDTVLQERVLKRLRRERRAAAVAMDVNGGEIVAMASVPTFSHDDIADGISEAAWVQLQAAKDDPLVNRAIAGQYPPGSTFKMVTALAGLKSGVIDPKERIACPGSFDYAYRTFRCWNRSGHGPCNLHRALRESCDVYFYETARRTGIDVLAQTAHAMGFGQTFEAGIALQKPGVMPTPAWKRGRIGRPWVGGDTVLCGIGQGLMLATPLQLAVMTARLATGRRVEPTLVRRFHTHAPPPPSVLDFDARHIAVIQRAMVAVVNEDGGTGSRAQLDEGPRIAGKTGTSQLARISSEVSLSSLPWDQRDHALFVAYFPADRPRYAIAAVVEHGGGGGATAAPLVRDIILELIARDPVGQPSLSGNPRRATGASDAG